jgi:hypothetical protein
MAVHNGTDNRNVNTQRWDGEMAGSRRLGNRIKMIAALVGGGAMVALAAVGALTGGGGTTATAVVSAPQMTMGATATVAYSATEETSMAVPTDKAKPYGGSGG